MSIKEKLEKMIENEEFGTRLSGIEDKILERGLLTGIVPVDFFDVMLIPEIQCRNEDCWMIFIIDIGTEEDASHVTDEQKEVIADFVSDYLLDRGFYEFMESLGIDDYTEVLDDFHVRFMPH